MIILNEQDIMRSISMQDLIGAIEEAYVLYENENFQMPARNHIIDQQNTCLLMPCVANQSISTKIVSVFPNNKDCPVTQGIVVLIDKENGGTKAILNGTLLTGLKTGAVGGVAAKYLTSKNAQSVGLIGTGYQGLFQLIATCTVRDIQHIYLYNRTSSKVPAFVRMLKKHLAPTITIHISENTLELVNHSDIIITSTSANQPVLPNESTIYNGKLIIGIGSYQPQMREFPENLYMNLKHIYIDTLDAKHESGDIIDPIQNCWIDESQVISFSQIITKKIEHNQSDQCPTVFKSTGMALFDLVVAETIVKNAKQQQIGTHITI